VAYWAVVTRRTGVSFFICRGGLVWLRCAPLPRVLLLQVDGRTYFNDRGSVTLWPTPPGSNVTAPFVGFSENLLAGAMLSQYEVRSTMRARVCLIIPVGDLLHMCGGPAVPFMDARKKN
jgi:hypothetical protein